MQTTKLKLLLVLALTVLWTAPSFARSVTFEIRFKNSTSKLIHVTLENGNLGKDISPGGSHKYSFRQGCNENRTKDFVVMNPTASLYSKRTWQVDLALTTGSKKGDNRCGGKEFEVECTQERNYFDAYCSKNNATLWTIELK